MRFLPLLLVFAATPALAIDFSRSILDPDGRPICVVEAEKECPADKHFTLAFAVRNALFGSYEDESKTITGDEKYKRAELAFTIGKGGEISVKAEDVALIKKVVGKAYAPLVVRQVWNMLEEKK